MDLSTPYGSSPRSTPRSIEEALAWESERLESTAWEGWAWKFQRLAFGYLRDGGWETTAEAYAWFVANGGVHRDCATDPAPRGALVWYGDSAEGPGVACALGDGNVIGPGHHHAVRIAAMAELPGLLGWTEAQFPFAR